MFSSLEWAIAARYLRSRREGFISLIAWLSVIGIALGVATLIIVMSVMNGFRSELLDRILGINGHITVSSVAGPISNYDTLTEEILSLSSVKSATPIIEGQVMVIANTKVRGAMVRGIRSIDLQKNQLILDNIISESINGELTEGGVVIGSRLAAALGLNAGDILTIIAPEITSTPFGTAPRLKSWKVAAIFEIGMYEYDIGMIYAPLEGLQTLFRVPGAVAAIELMVENPESPDSVTKMILPLGEDLITSDWRDSNVQFFQALEVERNVMFLILTLIILVAALNVVSGLIMLVKNKRSDIAILRTIGATRGFILRTFFIAGASVGVVGSISGLILGLGFAVNIESIRKLVQSIFGTELFSPEIYFLSTLPVSVNPLEVATVMFMSLFLSFVATLYPSWRAARTDPVEVLRSE